MISNLVITSVFTLCLVSLLFFLVCRVVLMRRRFKVGYGGGKHSELQQAISAHSNAVENIPVVIVLTALLELSGANNFLLSVIATVFVLARLFHAYGISHSIGVSFGRTYGTLVSWFVTLFMAAYLVAINL